MLCVCVLKREIERERDQVKKVESFNATENNYQQWPDHYKEKKLKKGDNKKRFFYGQIFFPHRNNNKLNCCFTNCTTLLRFT